MVFERRVQQLHEFGRAQMAQQHAHGDRGGLARAGRLQFRMGESGDLLVDVHGESA